MTMESLFQEFPVLPFFSLPLYAGVRSTRFVARCASLLTGISLTLAASCVLSYLRYLVYLGVHAAHAGMVLSPPPSVGFPHALWS